MTKITEHRYDVTFSPSQAPDGRPVIALTLNQDGQAAAGQDNIFFLEPGQALALDATSRIADFLNKYVSGFGVMIREQEGSQEQGQPEHGNDIGGIPPETMEGDATRPDEPNPEQEGQPIPPPQIDGVQEGEADAPHNHDAREN